MGVRPVGVTLGSLSKLLAASGFRVGREWKHLTGSLLRAGLKSGVGLENSMSSPGVSGRSVEPVGNARARGRRERFPSAVESRGRQVGRGFP